VTTLTARFENRDFTPYPRKHWTNLVVENYRKHVFGFSKKATINAYGSREDVWEFIQMLRCPVEIIDVERAKPLWWGFINRATINDGGIPFTISLDNMANRVAVAYTYQFQRSTTAWGSDADSNAEYGQKDLLLTAREKTLALAEQFRAVELENRKFPIGEPAFGRRGRRDISAKLSCKGWFDTTGWRYYSQDEGNEAYEDIGTGEREIGEDDRPKAAQGFQLSSAAGWTIRSIWLRVRKVGTPADNFQVALWDDSAGDPNAQLSATPDLAGGNITDAYVWYEFVLSTPYAASIATPYWIHVQRSGAVDSSNYYMIDANRDQGYAGGQLYIQRTSDSSWYDKNMDALFRVVGDEETTDQIDTIITDEAEFIEGTSIDDASGINSTQYRQGDQTALYEILELLKSGTTNNLRLLAEVTSIRQLRVFEEPAKYESDYTMSRDGRMIWDENGNVVLPQDCPVGVWMHLKDYIPATADTSKLANPSPIFVEEAEFDRRRGYRIIKTKSGVSAAESLQTTVRIG
jgi:hypothetical protein